MPNAIDWAYRLLAIFGIAAGILLVARVSHTLDVLRVYFFTAFLINGIAIVEMLRGMTSHDLDISLAYRPIAGIVAAVIWYLYFHTSQRVRTTYGKNI